LCGLKGPAATRMKQNTMATTPPAPMPPSSSESLDASVVATSASPPLARSPVAAVLTAVTVDRVLEPASVPLTMSVSRDVSGGDVWRRGAILHLVTNRHCDSGERGCSRDRGRGDGRG